MSPVVFLFGAGASFGSDTAGMPPLGNQLFACLQQFSPDIWGKIAGDLAEQFRQDFEAEMTQVSPMQLAPLQRAMADYFFRFSPTGANLYLELAQRIAAMPHWSGALCSLNYERLLEKSLLHAGLKPVVGPLPDNEDAAIECCCARNFDQACALNFDQGT